MRLGEDGLGNRFFFLQRIQNVKKKEKIYFLFSVLGRGGGGGGFFTKNPNLHIFLAEGGMEGVVWRGGSVARVDVNSFYKYSKSKQNKYHHPSPCNY